MYFTRNIQQNKSFFHIYSPDSSKDGSDKEEKWAPKPSEITVEKQNLYSVSEDVSCHDDQCCYARWLKQKAFLLTDGEVHSDLVAHYLRKWGSTMRNASGTLAKAMAKAGQDLSGGPVRDYLDSQRRIFDHHKNLEVKRCNCVSAQVPLLGKMTKVDMQQLPVITTTSNAAKVDIEQEDNNHVNDVNMNEVAEVMESKPEHNNEATWNSEGSFKSKSTNGDNDDDDCLRF